MRRLSLVIVVSLLAVLAAGPAHPAVVSSDCVGAINGTGTSECKLYLAGGQFTVFGRAGINDLIRVFLRDETGTIRFIQCISPVGQCHAVSGVGAPSFEKLRQGVPLRWIVEYTLAVNGEFGCSNL